MNQKELFRSNPFKDGLSLDLNDQKITAIHAEQTIEITQSKTIDKAEYETLTTAKIKDTFALSQSSYQLMQVIFIEADKIANTGAVYLNLRIVQEVLAQTSTKVMSKASFHRSIKELSTKNLIAPSIDQNMYFINPNIFTNSDCLRLVQEYKKK